MNARMRVRFTLITGWNLRLLSHDGLDAWQWEMWTVACEYCIHHYRCRMSISLSQADYRHLQQAWQHMHTHTPTHTGSAKLFNTVATCRAETSFGRFTGVTSSLYLPWTAMVEHEDCQWPAATLTARERENLLCKWCFSSCPAVY